MPISDYIVLEKVKVAKELLSHTERPCKRYCIIFGVHEFLLFYKTI